MMTCWLFPKGDVHDRHPRRLNQKSKNLCQFKIKQNKLQCPVCDIKWLWFSIMVCTWRIDSLDHVDTNRLSNGWWRCIPNTENLKQQNLSCNGLYIEKHLDTFRDLRGENRRKTKRENPVIVQLCDELLSEPNSTVRKVQQGLNRQGHRVSCSTIYRIAKDLLFRWTKPWYTDVLTPAQKLKRKIFCAQLLRLPATALLQRVGRWLFTDEKWFDTVGPSRAQYVKTSCKATSKTENQVFLVFTCLFFYYILCCRFLVIKVKRVESKNVSTSGRGFPGGGRPQASPGPPPTTR